MPLAVFLNPGAAQTSTASAALAEEIGEAFRRCGLPANVHLPQPADLLSAMRSEAARNPPAIIVGGGDGTLSLAAGVLAGTPVALGILPLGTLNHFAKDAGLPMDWRAAVETVAAFRTREVDVAEVNGRVVLNNCSIGGYTEALRRREVLRRRGGHGKVRAMLLAAVATCSRVPRLHVGLEGPDWSARLRASFVLVANNRYQDDALLSGRRSRLDEGRLWIYASRAYRCRDLGRALLEVRRLGLNQATQLESWNAERLTLRYHDSSLPVAIDGEVVRLDLPLRFRSRPRALRIIVPDDSSAERT